MDDTQNQGDEPVETGKQAAPLVTEAPFAADETGEAPAADAMNATGAEQPAPVSHVGGEMLEDKPADPDVLSAAPARPHEQLVSQLEMRWSELKEFVSRLEGQVDGELGDVLDLARHYQQG